MLCSLRFSKTVLYQKKNVDSKMVNIAQFVDDRHASTIRLLGIRFRVYIFFKSLFDSIFLRNRLPLDIRFGHGHNINGSIDSGRSPQ